MEAGGTSDRRTPEERRRQPESFKRRAEGTDEETGRPDCVQAEMPDCGQSAMSGSGRAEPPEKSGGEAGQGKVLAFDTSNYTTSVALTDLSGYILADERELLSVKKGERGLRQSHALFQHVENLPRLLDRALQQAGRDGIRAVAFSERPRPVEGSYMPVFRAGADFAAGIAAALGVPAYVFLNFLIRRATSRRSAERLTKGNAPSLFICPAGRGKSCWCRAAALWKLSAG